MSCRLEELVASWPNEAGHGRKGNKDDPRRGQSMHLQPPAGRRKGSASKSPHSALKTCLQSPVHLESQEYSSAKWSERKKLASPQLGSGFQNSVHLPCSRNNSCRDSKE